MPNSATIPADRPKYSGLFGWVRRINDWVEALAEKPYAIPALVTLAVCESIFFPIPVDVLLIAMCVGAYRRSLRFAMLTTVGSVAGGLVGYALGYWAWYTPVAGGLTVYSGLAQFFFDVVPGFTVDAFERVQVLYDQYNFIAVFIAGFTPLPYKVVTISAGVFEINLATFFVASLFSRAARFFLVAGLFFFFGAPIKAFIDKYLEWLSVAFVILLIGGFVVIKYVV